MNVGGCLMYGESMLMPALEVPDNLPSLDSKPVDSVSIMYTQSLGLDRNTNQGEG